MQDSMKEVSMRFMLVVVTQGYETAAANAAPGAEPVAKLMEYNKSLQKAGVLLGLDGLFPPSAGARVSHINGKATVMEGPFTGAKETGGDTIAGYWIIQVRSREEAIEWARRAPMADNEIIEVRRICEMGDFFPAAHKEAESFQELPDAAAKNA
jgi:hypothetical protein